MLYIAVSIEHFNSTCWSKLDRLTYDYDEFYQVSSFNPFVTEANQWIGFYMKWTSVTRVIRWFEKVIRKIIRSNKVWYLHIILGYADVVIAWNFVTLRIFS